MTISCRHHIQDWSIVRVLSSVTHDTSPYFVVNKGQDFHGLLFQTSIGLKKYSSDRLKLEAFLISDVEGISSVLDRFQIHGENIEVTPKREIHLVNLGRGDSCTKFEVNRTNIK